MVNECSSSTNIFEEPKGAVVPQVSSRSKAAALAVPLVGVAMFTLGPPTFQTPAASVLLGQVEYLSARAEGPLAEVLAAPGRLTILYWPALGECAPVEGGLIGVLEAFRERFDDTRVVSVIPAGWPEASRYGQPLPGRVVALSKADYESQTASGPLPRVEVWNAEHGLLLYRALSRVGAEVGYLTTELERARALTKPEPTAARAAL